MLSRAYFPDKNKVLNTKNTICKSFSNIWAYYRSLEKVTFLSDT